MMYWVCIVSCCVAARPARHGTHEGPTFATSQAGKRKRKDEVMNMLLSNTIGSSVLKH